MSNIVRAISPEVPEPAPGTWSNCLVVGGIRRSRHILPAESPE